MDGGSRKKNFTLSREVINCIDNEYYNFVPVKKGIALIGLVKKYNVQGTFIHSEVKNKRIEVHLLDGGVTSFVESDDKRDMAVKNFGQRLKPCCLQSLYPLPLTRRLSQIIPTLTEFFQSSFIGGCQKKKYLL